MIYYYDKSSHDKVKVGCLPGLDVNDVSLLLSRAPLTRSDSVATRWHHYMHVLRHANLETETNVDVRPAGVRPGHQGQL